MYETAIAAAGILGISMILSVLVYINGRLRIEQQRTLQKMLERGDKVEQLARANGFGPRADRDRRRGIVLVAIGVLWSLVTFFIGGSGWILGIVPVALGFVYMLFWKLDASAR